jgi:hypothetical protein
MMMMLMMMMKFTEEQIGKLLTISHGKPKPHRTLGVDWGEINVVQTKDKTSILMSMASTC